jgi:acyl-CoA reductase-like NAD-dependent aldehyde dehydrogenase
MKFVTNADRMLIGGALVESESSAWDDSINPSNEQVIGRSPAADKRDVARAVDAAEKAWPQWAERTPGQRIQVMREFKQRILERSEEILAVEVADTGNTIASLRGDVGVACDSIDYYAGLAYELKGETIPASHENLHITVREPYGVVARIVPFNHPLMFAVARTAAALAAGNAVIVKPPETSPLSALILSEIARDVFPAGVFNVVTGIGRVAGDAIVRHPAIKRISFIGSVSTGLSIQKAAAEVCVKNVSLELGGKNPMIVFPDADLDAAANAAVSGMNFAWQGQSCGSTSRLLLHADIHDAVMERVLNKVAALKVGDPANPETQMGPLNSAVQHNKVLNYIKVGKDDGAALVAGGERPQGSQFKQGYWVRPTVFADVRKNMRIAQEEVFGPVLSVMKWSSIEEAIDIANSTEYGLTAAIWTNDLDAALGTARRVRSGYQWINGFSAHFIGMPFGGYKNSGVGREEGIEELLSYTESKSINVFLRPPSLARLS